MDEQEQTLDIGRYVQIVYRRRRLCIIIAAVIMTLTTAASFFMPKIYEASTTVSIEKNYLNLLMRELPAAPSVEDRLEALSVVMTSRRSLSHVLEQLIPSFGGMSEEKKTKLVGYFQKNTHIKTGMKNSRRRDADLFSVTYRDPDPAFARDYVNALVNYYVVESMSAKRQEALGANRFIYEQMELYKNKIDKVEQVIAERKKQLGVDALARLEKLEERYDALRIQYTDDHPDVRRLKEEIATAKRKVERILHTGGLQTTAALQESAKSVNDLERERDAYKKVYESLVASLGISEVSTRAETQATADTFNILEPAILPVVPVNSPRWKIILLGILAGIAGSIGAVILLDMMDRSIKSVDALRDLGLPVIGIIPRITSAEAIIAAKKKDLLLYGFAGVYLAAICAIAIIEFLR